MTSGTKAVCVFYIYRPPILSRFTQLAMDMWLFEVCNPNPYDTPQALLTRTSHRQIPSATPPNCSPLKCGISIIIYQVSELTTFFCCIMLPCNMDVLPCIVKEKWQRQQSHERHFLWWGDQYWYSLMGPEQFLGGIYDTSQHFLGKQGQCGYKLCLFCVGVQQSRSILRQFEWYKIHNIKDNSF